MPPKQVQVNNESKLDLESTNQIDSIKNDIKQQLKLAYNTSDTDDIVE